MASALQRIENIESRVVHLEATAMEHNAAIEHILAETRGIKEDTSLILSTVRGVNAVGGFITKHGPRLYAFVLGALVAFGSVTPEVAKTLAGLIGQ